MRRNWPWSLPQQLQKTKVLKRRHWKAFFSTPCNTWKPIEFATRHLKDRQHLKKNAVRNTKQIHVWILKSFRRAESLSKQLKVDTFPRMTTAKCHFEVRFCSTTLGPNKKRKSWAGFDIIWNSPEVLEDIISWDKVFCVPGSRHNYQTWKVRAEWDWERPRRSWEALWWRPQKLGL